MGTSAIAVGNYFLSIEKAAITHLQLQKLAYLSHGWYLAVCGEPLVDDEAPEAWDFGPVFPSLYYEFRDFGRNVISRLGTTFVRAAGGGMKIHEPTVEPGDLNAVGCVRRIWKVYGSFNGGQLSSITHLKGSPWHEIRTSSGRIRNPHIPNDLIRKYYKDKLLKE